MFGLLKRKPAEPEPLDFTPALPEGERVYAIGDVHGRLDRLDALLAIIDADDASHGRARTSLILLGDLIDRGPDARGVVQRAMRLTQASEAIHILKGNHEEVMIAAYDGDEGAMRMFLRIGGVETLESYGVGLTDLPPGEEVETVIARMQETVPPAHIEFLRGAADQVQMGDYLFVHAGIRPGVPIEDQDPVEQRWIRDSFLRYAGHHGAMVVHGHSIELEPALKPNRIGIDTGAYYTGVLTAIGLEGTGRWLLQTEPDADRGERQEDW